MASITLQSLAVYRAAAVEPGPFSGSPAIRQARYGVGVFIPHPVEYSRPLCPYDLLCSESLTAAAPNDRRRSTGSVRLFPAFPCAIPAAGSCPLAGAAHFQRTGSPLAATGQCEPGTDR